MPTNESNEAMGQEGATFWTNKVALLVSTGGKERFDVEKRVQLDIMDYYDRLFGQSIDWCIPPRSRLVGHGPAIAMGPELMYQLNGGHAEEAGTFFSRLDEENDK